MTHQEIFAMLNSIITRADLDAPCWCGNGKLIKGCPRHDAIPCLCGANMNLVGRRSDVFCPRHDSQPVLS